MREALDPKRLGAVRRLYLEEKGMKKKKKKTIKDLLLDVAPEHPWRRKAKIAKPPEEREGFHSRNFTGECVCGLNMKNHPICQACGALVGSQEHWQAPCDFRERTLCGFCVRRWKKLDSIMQWAENRDATWGEMLTGVTLGKMKGRKEALTPTMKIVSTPLATLRIRDTTLSVQTANALVRNGVVTIGELIQKTPEELFRFRLLGTTKIAEIREFLSKNGLRLR